MSNASVSIIITLSVFVANMILLFQIFPSRFDLRITIGILAGFTVCEFSVEFLLGEPLRFDYGGLRGVLYFPILIFLLKGQLFQKLFAFFLELVLTVSFTLLIIEILNYFTGDNNPAYNAILLAILFVIYIAYVVIVTKKKQIIYEKLFAYGSTLEWFSYSLIGLFAFVVMSYSRLTRTSSLYFSVILVFIILSYCVLCLTIANTHEKAKQRFHAEFAQKVISSGRDHYQKMDEMYDKLRTLRHDYKYHLVAISELLASDDKDELNRYLEGINTRLDESEVQAFCNNTVINALLASYAARCEERAISFNADISLPETLSVPNYDLCIVVGNLLQNAMEACQEQENNKQIEIVIKPLGNQLAIRVKNSFNGNINTNGSQLKSIKKDGGFGVRSVETVAARYDGELLFNWESGIFSAYVTLKQ